MKVIRVLGLLAAAGASALFAQGRGPAVIAITNATVIDMVAGSHQTGVTVVTKGGQIAGIGQRLSVPQGAVRVDGTGKYLIPGLWDMHSHNQASGVESLDLYLANGVVGTRDMGSDLAFILPLRDRIRRGETRGPEIVASGPMLDNAPANWPYRRRVTNAEEARDAVRDLKKHGVDFIKVHNNTPRDVFFAIAEEAPKLGLTFAGHIPLAVTIDEGASSGIKSIEHLSESRVFREPMPHEEYASDAAIEMNRENARASNVNEAGLTFLRSMSKTSLAVVRDMLSRGNVFMAGCDGGVPGFCLHDEMQILTEAGLTPLQAIQAATINPARFLGREKAQGTIAAGMRADLVMLDADPRAEIRNTRRISAVMYGGRLLSKADIDRLIAARRRPAGP